MNGISYFWNVETIPMKNLEDLLNARGYKKIPFKVSKTQHLLVKVTINGVKGTFILDTGASNSCVGSDHVAFFNLAAKASKTKAAGAGATGMETQIATNNSLKIGRWHSKNTPLIVFDMSHVNTALKQYKARSVHGIIGADMLLKGNAIIDYATQYVYLQS